MIRSTPMEAEALLLGNFMLGVEVVVLCIPGCDCNVCILAAGRGDACAILKGKHCVASCFKKPIPFLSKPGVLYCFVSLLPPTDSLIQLPRKGKYPLGRIGR